MNNGKTPRARITAKQPSNAETHVANGNGKTQRPKPFKTSSFVSRVSVSVIIPLCGGQEDFAKCLESLNQVGDLLHEVIVVDNASPDGAVALVESFRCSQDEASGSVARRGSKETILGSRVLVIRNEENRGFAAACNQGIRASTGDVVLLLNSDTYLTRTGLIELLNTLMSHGAIAAAGPYTNNAAYHQMVQVTYTSLETAELFAQDFAARPVQDRDVDMLVGFCLALKRSALEEISFEPPAVCLPGAADTAGHSPSEDRMYLDERFALGTFEDNDLCYRLRREGYRLVISAKSFVHHTGSKTLIRLGIDPRALLTRNRDLYTKKWQDDLQIGFSTGLSGLTSEAIRFDSSKKPEATRAQCRLLASRAEISLCMITRDEERCIAECLNSVKDFVSEMIVVDTGSTDRTAEIAAACGAKVYHFPWTKSFAEARNESLKYATGRWILWIDADDVVPLQSGIELVNNALSAPERVGAFVVPVQFTEDGPAGGVRVDHVKLFRNDPALRFTHRIHEQILESIRARGYEVARSRAIVLHANYDSSETGQEKKRNRDRELLSLDLKENPDHPFVMFNLGMTAYYLKQYARAERWLRRSIRACSGEESHLRKAYDLLALSLIQRERKVEGEAILRAGLAKMPDDAEMNFHLAQLLSAKEQFEEARTCYDRVLNADMTAVFTSIDQGLFGFKTLHNRAEVDARLGNYDGAREGFIGALKQAPTFLVSAFHLFEVALENKDYATARETLEHVHVREGFSDNWSKMAAKYGAALLDTDFALDLLRRAFESDPNALAPRMQFCRLLLNCGDISNALPHLMFLQERGVAEAAHFLGVAHIQSGQLKVARDWMKRAQSLNPGQPQTVEALAKLEEVIRGAA